MPQQHDQKGKQYEEKKKEVLFRNFQPIIFISFFVVRIRIKKNFRHYQTHLTYFGMSHIELSKISSTASFHRQQSYTQFILRHLTRVFN